MIDILSKASHHQLKGTYSNIGLIIRKITTLLSKNADLSWFPPHTPPIGRSTKNKNEVFTKQKKTCIQNINTNSADNVEHKGKVY